MKEKILKNIEKIKISHILKVKENTNLINSKSILDVKPNDQSITVIIDLAPLNISKEEALALQDLLEMQLKDPSTSLFKKSKKINIIFTTNQTVPQNNNSTKSKTDKIKPNEAKANKKPIQNIKPIPYIKNIIAIASGKGGVGKSTIAVNLALSLKRIGLNTALADADIYGPSITHMMNLQNKPKIEKELMIPIHSYGIKCMSIGSLMDKDQALVWRGPMITKTINQLIKGTNWGHDDKEIDYLIIDLPPGTGDIHLSIAQQFPIAGAVIVSTPQDIAVIDAVKAIDMFQKLDIPIIGLVQNMSYLQDEKTGQKTYLFGQDKAKELAQKNNIKFLGDVPIDIKTRECCDNKNPIANSYPSSKTSMCYGKIAENITDFF